MVKLLKTTAAGPSPSPATAALLPLVRDRTTAVVLIQVTRASIPGTAAPGYNAVATLMETQAHIAVLISRSLATAAPLPLVLLTTAITPLQARQGYTDGMAVPGIN